MADSRWHLLIALALLAPAGSAARADSDPEGDKKEVDGRPDPGNLVTLRGQIGKSFYFEVTGSTSGSVWGTDEYTDDSRLAVAAVHAGALKNGVKGVVKVTILAGKASYDGSARNGVTTGRWDAYPGSYKVEAARGVKIRAPKGNVQPAPEDLEDYRAHVGKSFLFEVVGSTEADVWGSDVYTDDSCPATAAVHAGIVKSGEKGIIKVTILAGQRSYDGTTRNGVASDDWDGHDGSFKVEAVKQK